MKRRHLGGGIYETDYTAEEIDKLYGEDPMSGLQAMSTGEDSSMPRLARLIERLEKVDNNMDRAVLQYGNVIDRLSGESLAADKLNELA